jgi:glycosyltransferase involved in cell wall biosynthesis
MSSLLVSVVMPAYNHEKYVAAAIESVLKQSLGDLELIIVNDGSRDGTERVIRTFDDPRIRYFTQENQGAHVAINRGLKLARGEYLAILNSDDVYAPQRLERLLQHAEMSGLDFLFTEVEHIDSKSRSLAPGDPRKAGYEELLQQCYAGGNLLSALLLGNFSLTSSNFFMSRAVSEQIGPFAAYRYAHDFDYLLRAFLACGLHRVTIVPERLLKYRRHGKNTVIESQSKVYMETWQIMARHLPSFMCCDSDRNFAESVLAPVLMRAGKELAELTSTRSWELTAPLRLAAEALRIQPRAPK